MDSISFTDKYVGINAKALAENYDRAYKLYEGNWVQFGDYPEDGDFITNNEDRDRAIEIIGQLYHHLEPYNQQIRADYQIYDQMDRWERHNIQGEDGWILARLHWICEFYDTHIKFMDELRSSQQPQQAPIVGKPQQKKKRGRRVEAFKSVLMGTDEELKERRLQRLHKVADGRRGKEFAKLILAAIIEGWISKPSHTQVNAEFGDIGSKTGYNRYLVETMYSEAEIQGAKNALNR